MCRTSTRLQTEPNSMKHWSCGVNASVDFSRASRNASRSQRSANIFSGHATDSVWDRSQRKICDAGSIRENSLWIHPWHSVWKMKNRVPCSSKNTFRACKMPFRLFPRWRNQVRLCGCILMTWDSCKARSPRSKCATGSRMDTLTSSQRSNSPTAAMTSLCSWDFSSRRDRARFLAKVTRQGPRHVSVRSTLKDLFAMRALWVMQA
mmetsp:Transcript_8168/g.16281  ORF Transcript_8168/g.16281 Transcript_8168/m.16281 type:complete len:206 (-) Transcript_8168:1399-2016(-)